MIGGGAMGCFLVGEEGGQKKDSYTGRWCLFFLSTTLVQVAVMPITSEKEKKNEFRHVDDTIPWRLPAWGRFPGRYTVVCVLAVVVVTGINWQLIFTFLILFNFGLHTFFFQFFLHYNLVMATLSTATID